jgi:hypothetical protein
VSLTNSLLAARRGSQTPRVASWPDYSYTSGDDAADLAASAGLILDEWQRYVLRHSLGERPDSKWAATEAACFVPRQSGKGAIIEARVLAGLFLFGERLIVWTAHEYKTAHEGFLRLRELIRGAPHLHKLVKRYWEGSGEQGIELVTGQRLRFLARSKGSGRGFSGDTVILDEAQALTLEQMKALFSTLSAKPNPQVWYFGTPPNDATAWIYGVREDGESGKPRLAYFDWGLDLDHAPGTDEFTAALADRDLWYQANPSLGIRITEEFCEDELARLKEGFAPERLGVWLPRAAGGAGVISEQLWTDLADPKTVRPTDVAMAIEVNPARTHAAIVMIGPRDDGKMVISIADYRPGTTWIAERAAELKERWNPVAIGLDLKAPGGTLLLDLEKVGITAPEDPGDPQRGDLATLGAVEAATAYGLFVDLARNRGLVHLDEAPLNTAVSGAPTRPLAGGSAWDRRATVDVAPLIGATNAHWAYVTRIDAVSKPYDPLDNIY